MFKFYLFFGILAVSVACSFFAGYQIASGKAAKKQVKVTKEAIKDSNEDKQEIIKHVSKVNQATNEAVREIIKIKTITTTEPCPIADVVRLQQQTYTSFPSMHFHGSDSMPSANPSPDNVEEPKH
jgi:uncharacterized protein (UPF0333 family)